MTCYCIFTGQSTIDDEKRRNSDEKSENVDQKQEKQETSGHVGSVEGTFGQVFSVPAKSQPHARADANVHDRRRLIWGVIFVS